MQRKVSTPAIGFARAEQADAEALVALRVLAMRESLERLGRFDPVRSRERFLSAFSPQHTRHILVDGERAVGQSERQQFRLVSAGGGEGL